MPRWTRRIADPLGNVRFLREHAQAHGFKLGTLCWRGAKFGWDDPRTWAGSRLDLPEPEPETTRRFRDVKQAFGGFI